MHLVVSYVEVEEEDYVKAQNRTDSFRKSNAMVSLAVQPISRA
jgi:hypothetical protein